MKFVLVAGASGYLGRFVVQELKRKGYRVRALTRQRDKLWKRGTDLAPAVGSEIDEIITADLSNAQALQGACQDINYVISCAGAKPTLSKTQFEHNDYFGNRNLLIESINSGSVEKFVYVSMQAPQKAHELAILQAKERFVKDLQNSVMTSHVIRPSLYYPSLLPLLYMAHRGKVWLPGIGDKKISPIHGADLATACVKGILAKEKEIEIGGPKALSFVEIAEIAFKAQKKNAKIASIPMALKGVAGNLLRLANNKQFQDYLRLQELRLQTLSNQNQGEQKIIAYFKDYLASPFFRP